MQIDDELRWKVASPSNEQFQFKYLTMRRMKKLSSKLCRHPRRVRSFGANKEKALHMKLKL